MSPLILAATLAADRPRCEAYAANFAKVVACERADGTLRSFRDWSVAWRVRYFVRFWEMPCGEFPTEQEAYVFHMVTNDLYNDADLSDADRIDIRNLMFAGRVRCP